MFNKQMIRGVMFLSVILLVACMMVYETDGFLGQPQRNKEQCNTECQNAKRKNKKNTSTPPTAVAPTTAPTVKK